MYSPNRIGKSFQEYQELLKQERKLEMQLQMSKGAAKSPARSAQVVEKIDVLPVPANPNHAARTNQDNDIFGVKANQPSAPIVKAPMVEQKLMPMEPPSQPQYTGLGLSQNPVSNAFTQFAVPSPQVPINPFMIPPFIPYYSPSYAPHPYLAMSPLPYLQVPQMHHSESNAMPAIAIQPTVALPELRTQAILPTRPSKQAYAAALDNQIKEREQALSRELPRNFNVPIKGQIRGNLYRDVNFDISSETSPFNLDPPEMKTGRRFVI